MTGSIKSTISQHVFPAPSGLLAWWAWEDGTTNGPYPVLALAVSLESASTERAIRYIDKMSPKGRLQRTPVSDFTDAWQVVIADTDIGDLGEMPCVHFLIAAPSPEECWLEWRDVGWTENDAMDKAKALKEAAEQRNQREVARRDNQEAGDGHR